MRGLASLYLSLARNFLAEGVFSEALSGAPEGASGVTMHYGMPEGIA